MQIQLSKKKNLWDTQRTTQQRVLGPGSKMRDVEKKNLWCRQLALRMKRCARGGGETDPPLSLSGSLCGPCTPKPACGKHNQSQKRTHNAMHVCPLTRIRTQTQKVHVGDAWV